MFSVSPKHTEKQNYSAFFACNRAGPQEGSEVGPPVRRNAQPGQKYWHSAACTPRAGIPASIPHQGFIIFRGQQSLLLGSKICCFPIRRLQQHTTFILLL
jgi:hypothetical protein